MFVYRIAHGNNLESYKMLSVFMNVYLLPLFTHRFTVGITINPYMYLYPLPIHLSAYQFSGLCIPNFRNGLHGFCILSAQKRTKFCDTGKTEQVIIDMEATDESAAVLKFDHLTYKPTRPPFIFTCLGHCLLIVRGKAGRQMRRGKRRRAW